MFKIKFYSDDKKIVNEIEKVNRIRFYYDDGIACITYTVDDYKVTLDIKISNLLSIEEV